MNFLVYGNRHLRGHNVVSGLGIMRGVETKEILRSFIDELGVIGTELSIGTWVTEIESELSGLDLDRHGVSRWSGEIYVRPCFHSKDSERQHFRAYEQQGADHQGLGAAGKILGLCPHAAVREHPDENRQNELCG